MPSANEKMSNNKSYNNLHQFIYGKNCQILKCNTQLKKMRRAGLFEISKSLKYYKYNTET